MPCISISTALTTAGSSNILSGDIFEFIQNDALLSVGFAASATGVVLTVSASERILGRNLIPVVKATTPLKPDDFIIMNEPVLAGERLVIACTATATQTLLTVVCIDEVG